jgi:FkbM family methyltransferase
MGILQKISKASDNPSEAMDTLKRKANQAVFLAETKQIGPLLGFITHTFTNRDLYRERLTESEYALCEVLNQEMFVDLLDEGISTELYYNGFREPETTRQYRELLFELKRNQGEVTVLEIGCNIGYYALIAADILDGSGNIHAFEPDPKNIELARKNIEANGHWSVVQTHQYAIGNAEGEAEFQRHPTHSNWSHITETDRVSVPDVDPNPDAGETITVDVKSIDGYIEESAIDRNTVDIVRMDVEGYEKEVIEGMTDLIRESDNLIVVLELHLLYLEDDSVSEIIEIFEGSGFEIVSSSPPNVNRFSDIYEYEFLNLIMKKSSGP